MIIAEAIASDDRALTFSRISLRARRMAERLASASARLPPVFCWMASTTVKNRSSGVGMRSNIFSRPWSIGSPMDRLSTRRWNSGPSGAGLSRAMMRRQSLTGRPDLMPRTMMSMASEKAAVNFLVRRLARKPTTQRGRPRPAAKRRAATAGPAAAGAGTGSPPATTAPNTPLAIQNCCGVTVRPACWRRASSVTDALRWLRSCSLRVFNSALRRWAGSFAAALARLVLSVRLPAVIAWARLTVLALVRRRRRRTPGPGRRR